MRTTRPNKIGRFVPGLVIALVVIVCVVAYQGMQKEPEPALLQSVEGFEQMKSEQERTMQDILRLQGKGLEIVEASFKPSNDCRGVVVDLRVRNASEATKDGIPVLFRWKLAEDARLETCRELHRLDKKLQPGEQLRAQVLLPLTENQTFYLATSETIAAGASVNSINWIAASRQP